MTGRGNHESPILQSPIEVFKREKADVASTVTPEKPRIPHFGVSHPLSSGSLIDDWRIDDW
jgi:hypothetical protein